jgi:2,4-dienoyl-CoA reductase-like NADH-dependent reductase (Old Yellow Enzyme family)
MVEAIGAELVGIRLAPFNQQFDMPLYHDGGETYLFFARELTKRRVAYVHLNDSWAAGRSVIDEAFLRRFRNVFDGTLILAGAMTIDRAQDLVDEGLIDLPAFGQPFIANCDLVERLRNGRPLATPNRDTWYGGGSAGYTDYPTLTEA